MDAEDPEMRERPIALKLKRDERARQIADLQKQMTSSQPIIPREKIERLADMLHDKLFGENPELRQA